jgi:PAS domain S-box-containing protein
MLKYQRSPANSIPPDGSYTPLLMEPTDKLVSRIQELEAQITALQVTAAQKEIEVRTAAYQKGQSIFKTIFEESRLGNKVINRDLTIIKVNMALITLLGYTDKADILGKKIIDFTPSDRKHDWKILQEKLWDNSTPSFSLETCLTKKDGTIVWCQVTSILFSEQNETLGYTIIEDVTEQHNLRMQKEQFIGVASHELKTPITSLKVIVQLMNRTLAKGGAITDKLVKFGKDSDRQVTKLIHLVDGLLSSTRLEQGQLSLNKSSFTFSNIVDGCCSHIELAGEYSLVFEGDRRMQILADEQKVEQVLVNLINNAVKYAPESKEIVVRVEQIEGFSKISVIDRGQGIPEESVSKLFERYYRVPEFGYTPGLGLGLYISSEIVARHGGEMGVDSTVGEGSTFWFTLPDRDVA